tara:strand:+ start:1009 stop:2097 length:1089 start_codon:yes stop_codon:yes gene_type:complete
MAKKQKAKKQKLSKEINDALTGKYYKETKLDKIKGIENKTIDIIKRQHDQMILSRQKLGEITRTRDTLINNFGSLQAALEKITTFKSDDPATIALQQIRKSTESFQRVMEKYKQDLATINPLTGAVRKQRFKNPELTNQVVQSLKPTIRDDYGNKLVQENLKKVEENRKKLIEALTNKNKPEPKKKVVVLKDGRKRTHLFYGHGSTGRGAKFMDWLWDNDVHDTFGIISHYKNKKSKYSPESWDDLCDVLRSLNFTKDEVLDYAISKIQTKERFLEHRLYRNIEKKNASGLEEFIEIYRKFLKEKLPFKVFFHSPELTSWCASQDVFFNSEENCRFNKDLLLRAWNKKYPEDKIKISDKKKK